MNEQTNERMIEQLTKWMSGEWMDTLPRPPASPVKNRAKYKYQIKLKKISRPEY